MYYLDLMIIMVRVDQWPVIINIIKIAQYSYIISIILLQIHIQYAKHI